MKPFGRHPWAVFRAPVQGVTLAAAIVASLVRAAHGDTVVVVNGNPGAPEYSDVFAQSADRWIAAAQHAHATAINIGRGPLAGGTDKQQLLATLHEQSTETTAPLWLVLIGHGTFDGKEAKFNLRDVDISDAELAEALRPFKRPLAVINCASASAPFLPKLSAPDRVIITATRSGSEIQYARFGQYLAQAIIDPDADLDKDGQTSLLEAFLAAAHHTEEFYKREGRLATEHALLDDNGDGLGTTADFFEGVRAVKAPRNNAAVDGPRAHQWHLVRSAQEKALSPDLRARRDALELELDALRARKSSLPESDYYARLDTLLLTLGRLYAQAPQASSTQPASH